jgi:hypothetical protein
MFYNSVRRLIVLNNNRGAPGRKVAGRLRLGQGAVRSWVAVFMLTSLQRCHHSSDEAAMSFSSHWPCEKLSAQL